LIKKNEIIVFLNYLKKADDFVYQMGINILPWKFDPNLKKKDYMEKMTKLYPNHNITKITQSIYRLENLKDYNFQ